MEESLREGKCQLTIRIEGKAGFSDPKTPNVAGKTIHTLFSEKFARNFLLFFHQKSKTQRFHHYFLYFTSRTNHFSEIVERKLELHVTFLLFIFSIFSSSTLEPFFTFSLGFFSQFFQNFYGDLSELFPPQKIVFTFSILSINFKL